MKVNIFTSLLKHSIKEFNMVSVYSNRYQPEKCSVGFVEAVTNEHFFIKHVSPVGTDDGYIVRRMSDVFRVDFGGEYEKRLNLLYTLQNQQHQNFFDRKPAKSSNLFRESLIVAKKKNLIVSVCIDETENQENVVGFVKDINSEGATISRISLNGLDDGESTLILDDVIKIDCDSLDERTLKILYSHNKNLSDIGFTS